MQNSAYILACERVPHVRARWIWAWLTPYIASHVNAPPITKLQTVCLVVGFGSKLKKKKWWFYLHSRSGCNIKQNTSDEYAITYKLRQSALICPLTSPLTPALWADEGFFCTKFQLSICRGNPMPWLTCYTLDSANRSTLRLLDTCAAKTHENWPPLHVSLNNSVIRPPLRILEDGLATELLRQTCKVVWFSCV